MYKGAIKLGVVVSIVFFGGCSRVDDETYLDKIERFEFKQAAKQVVDAEKAVLNYPVSQDFNYQTLMNYPIPLHFKKTHQKYGVDVSKIKYVDSDWAVKLHESKLVDSEQKQLPTHHHHH